MKAAKHIIGYISKGIASRLRNYSSLLGILRIHVEYCIQFSTHPTPAQDIYWNKLSKRATRTTRVQKHLVYEERLREQFVQNGERDIPLLSTST